MGQKALVRFAAGFAFCVFARPVFAEADYGSRIRGDEAVLHAEKYGRGEMVTVSNGYLFVDCKYVPAPYAIQRVGQAVAVNGIVVNCLYKREIPESHERHVQKFKGSSGREYEWRSPGHPSGNLKETADFWAGMLAHWLRSKAVFLSRARFAALHGRLKPADDTALEKAFPKVLDVDCADFLLLFSSVLDAQSEKQAAELFKANTAYSKLTDADIMALIENARASPALAERLRAEAGQKAAPNP